MLEIEEMEIKKLKAFQKLLERISSSTILSTIRAGRARAEKEKFTWKLRTKPRTRHIWKYCYHT